VTSRSSNSIVVDGQTEQLIATSDIDKGDYWRSQFCDVPAPFSKIAPPPQTYLNILTPLSITNADK
jgi:hypothetical protein